MVDSKRKLPELAREETLPEIPRKIRWKAKIFGKKKIADYLEDYYEKESEERIPFYLPYIYMKENFGYLRRYGQIAKPQVSLVLIDGNDERTDYVLCEVIEMLNFLTIVTERKEYFRGLQERAFQELGLLIDVVRSWENKNLQGNLVWDFTERLQQPDCYPKGSICFLPHKQPWKIRETLRVCPNITVVTMKEVEILERRILPNLAETLLVPPQFPFRKTRCEELKAWCRKQRWDIKMKAQTLENP